ncbi:conserved hypothetical protein [Vibrio phage 137E35-1]|nr:conserved hypothetical protein [Vibrio phage 137E35-1]CAH9016517.1 conserved hypothetical protein [Vibrio phage 230E39-1]
MKKFELKLKAKSEDQDVQTVKLDGSTNEKSKRADVIAWAATNYPHYEVEELRLFKA